MKRGDVFIVDNCEYCDSSDPEAFVTCCGHYYIVATKKDLDMLPQFLDKFGNDVEYVGNYLDMNKDEISRLMSLLDGLANTESWDGEVDDIRARDCYK